MPLRPRMGRSTQDPQTVPVDNSPIPVPLVFEKEEIDPI